MWRTPQYIEDKTLGGSRSLDIQLFHPESEGAWIQPQPFGGAILPFDLPMGMLEHLENMFTFHVRKSHGRIGRRFPWMRGCQFADGSQGWVMTARSTRFSSSRILPGHA